MRQVLIKSLTAISGAILVGIGAALLFAPLSFAASNGIMLTGTPSLLSELRAPGGLLLMSGVIVFLGTVRQNMMPMSLGLAALIYGSYGFARLWSILLDGLPSATLTQAMFLELCLGALCLTVLVFLQRKQNRVSRR